MKCDDVPGCNCQTCEMKRQFMRNAHAAKKQACQVCKAKPGQSCQNGGRRTLPHAERYVK